jgi:hypothetical protein
MTVLRHNNEVVVAYMPTGARLKPYFYLDELKGMAIYWDIDSVICIQDCGQPAAVTCGDNLGNMTNELGPDEYIEVFLFGSPRIPRTKPDAHTPERNSL